MLEYCGKFYWIKYARRKLQSEQNLTVKWCEITKQPSPADCWRHGKTRVVFVDVWTRAGNPVMWPIRVLQFDDAILSLVPIFSKSNIVVNNEF